MRTIFGALCVLAAVALGAVEVDEAGVLVLTDATFDEAVAQNVSSGLELRNCAFYLPLHCSVPPSALGRVSVGVFTAVVCMFRDFTTADATIGMKTGVSAQRNNSYYHMNIQSTTLLSTLLHSTLLHSSDRRKSFVSSAIGDFWLLWSSRQSAM